MDLTLQKNSSDKIIKNYENHTIYIDKDQYEQDLGRKSLQCGRRADALKLWLTWKYFGDRGSREVS